MHNQFKFIPLGGGKEIMNTLVKKEKGFTIIEVVLVLAIAGLIFLVVFLALPALQRSQRDNQRRSDIGRAVAAVQSWQSNKNGQSPTATELATASSFITPYLTSGGASFSDPSGGDYSFNSVTTLATARTSSRDGANATWSSGKLYFVKGTTCDGTPKTNAISIVAGLESGGEYCQNN